MKKNGFVYVAAVSAVIMAAPLALNALSVAAPVQTTYAATTASTYEQQLQEVLAVATVQQKANPAAPTSKTATQNATDAQFQIDRANALLNASPNSVGGYNYAHAKDATNPTYTANGKTTSVNAFTYITMKGQLVAGLVAAAKAHTATSQTLDYLKANGDAALVAEVIASEPQSGVASKSASETINDLNDTSKLNDDIRNGKIAPAAAKSNDPAITSAQKDLQDAIDAQVAAGVPDDQAQFQVNRANAILDGGTLDSKGYDYAHAYDTQNPTYQGPVKQGSSTMGTKPFTAATISDQTKVIARGIIRAIAKDPKNVSPKVAEYVNDHPELFTNQNILDANVGGSAVKDITGLPDVSKALQDVAKEGKSLEDQNASSTNTSTTLVNTTTTPSTTKKTPAKTDETTTPEPANITGIAKVNTATPVYNGKFEASERTLPVNSSWKVFNITTAEDGTLYYNLGGDQYVRADAVHLDTNSPQTDDSDVTIPAAGRIATVKYVPGYGIQLWTDAELSTMATNQNGNPRKLADKTSWKVFAIVKNGSQISYNLGGSQYIDAAYATLK